MQGKLPPSLQQKGQQSGLQESWVNLTLMPAMQCDMMAAVHFSNRGQCQGRPTTEKLPADGKCVPCFLHAFDSLWLIQHKFVSGNAKVPTQRYSFHFKAFFVTAKGAVKNQVL